MTERVQMIDRPCLNICSFLQRSFAQPSNHVSVSRLSSPRRSSPLPWPCCGKVDQLPWALRSFNLATCLRFLARRYASVPDLWNFILFFLVRGRLGWLG